MPKSLTYGVGLLDYNDDSPHIIRRLPLTSNDVDGIGSATVIGTSAGTFDSTLGYKPYYTDGSSPAPANGYLSFGDSSNPLLPANLTSRILGGYTISVEVQSSEFFNLSTLVNIFEILPVTASNRIRLSFDAATAFCNVGYNQGSRVLNPATNVAMLNTAARITGDDYISDGYIRLYLSVSTGGKYDIFAGKKWLFSGQCTSALVSDTDPLNVVTVGGSSFGETFNGYLRNLMVIDKPISLIFNNNVGRISMIGDSITQQGNTTANTNMPFSSARYGAVAGTTTFADYTLPSELHRRFSNNDRYVQPYSFAVSGGSMSLAGATKIIDQVNGVNAANARLHRPHVVTIGGGTNDIIGSRDMTDGGANSFGEGYRAVLDEILSWGFVKGIVFANISSLTNNPIYDTPTYATATTTGNSTIESLKNEYANSYRNVKFSIADRYTAFGGASPNADYFQAADLHPNAIGQYVQAETIYNAIVDLGL